MSIWNKFEYKKTLEELNRDIDIDILVIGAGITGMTTSYYLKDENIAIVEKDQIGHGVTLNSTAKINYFQETIYTKIKSILGTKYAKKYLNSQIDAIKLLKNIILKEKIDCDFKRVSSYVFASSKNEVKVLEKEVKFLKNNNIEVIEKSLPDKIKSYKSYCVNDTYVFNPIKYLYGIYEILKKDNIPIYENTKVIDVQRKNNKYICLTNKYKIKANKIIFACQYPYFLKNMFLPLRSYNEKSYIIISKVNKDKNYTCINTNKPTYSSRFYQDKNNIYQISLGQSHNIAFKLNDKNNFKKVKEMFNLKDKDIIMKYTNSDIITLDHMPLIGKINKNIYISCGYNTWGMTNGILGASIISDMIKGKSNKYENTFNPKRFNLSNAIYLPLIIVSQTKSFLGTKIFKNKSWYKSVKFINKNGKSIGIYKDKNSINHVVYNKCPHLGCSLIFNEEEKTFDCPCHSSRFDMNGKCIKGPSIYDISYKDNYK